MKKKDIINSLKKGTLLKIVPQGKPDVATVFDIEGNEFFEVPRNEHILFLKGSALGNAIGLYEEKIVMVLHRDVKKVEL